MEEQMKILITGGAGYVGSLLVPALLARNHQVRVVDNLMYGQSPLLPYFIDSNFEFIKGDIRSANVMQQALENMDFIIHLAAIVGDPACRKNEKLAQEVNLDATIQMLNLRKKDQKIVYSSTGSVYGALDSVCTEESPVNPLSHYGKTKYWAEQAVMRAGNAVVYRFATGFGLSSRLRLDLLPNNFAYQAVHNRSLIVFERNFRRTFIHVRDMVSAFLFAIENFDSLKDSIFNVGSEKLNCTKEDVALELKKIVDYVVLFVDKGFTDPDKRNYEVCYDKIRNKGFATRISLKEGLIELVKGCQTLSLRNPYSNVEEI
jgi:nucleoside-diphosphate-sugar epimerase